MYISCRAAFVRNLGVALLNGGITLVILLIAPLGLAAVIINTILVIAASFVNATAGDVVVNFLQPTQLKTMLAETVSQESRITKKNDK